MPKKAKAPKQTKSVHAPAVNVFKDKSAIITALRFGVLEAELCANEKRPFDNVALKKFNAAVGDALIYLMEQAK